MTLQSSGNPISFSQVNQELRRSSTATLSLDDATLRTLFSEGGSGTASSMNNGYGKEYRVNCNITYSSHTADVQIDVSLLSGYVTAATNINITVNSGIYVYASSTIKYALEVYNLSGYTGTGIGYGTGDTVYLYNYGYIMARGGDGGSVSGYYLGYGYGFYDDYGPKGGNYGGPAIRIARMYGTDNGATHAYLYNYGYIAAGGGGGAAGWDTTGGGGAGAGNGGGWNHHIEIYNPASYYWCCYNDTYGYSPASYENYYFYVAGGSGGGLGASGADGNNGFYCSFYYGVYCCYYGYTSYHYGQVGKGGGAGGGRVLPGNADASAGNGSGHASGYGGQGGGGAGSYAQYYPDYFGAYIVYGGAGRLNTTGSNGDLYYNAIGASTGGGGGGWGQAGGSSRTSSGGTGGTLTTITGISYTWGAKGTTYPQV